MRMRINLNMSFLKLACSSLLKFQPSAIFATNSVVLWFQWKSVQGRLPDKNVKSGGSEKRLCSDVNSTWAGSFLLFLCYIDNIPDCLLWKEQLQWGVSLKWVGEFCHLSASHSSLHSLDVDLQSCSPCYFPFPSVFFHFYPRISFLFSVYPLSRANNLLVSWIMATLYNRAVPANSSGLTFKVHLDECQI